MSKINGLSLLQILARAFGVETSCERPEGDGYDEHSIIFFEKTCGWDCDCDHEMRAGNGEQWAQHHVEVFYASFRENDTVEVDERVLLELDGKSGRPVDRKEAYCLLKRLFYRKAPVVDLPEQNVATLVWDVTDEGCNVRFYLLSFDEWKKTVDVDDLLQSAYARDVAAEIADADADVSV